MGWLGAATEVLIFGGSDGPCWRRPGKISRSEWREFARQKREMMQRFNSEKEALIADNKRLREAQVPAVMLRPQNDRVRLFPALFLVSAPSLPFLLPLSLSLSLSESRTQSFSSLLLSFPPCGSCSTSHGTNRLALSAVRGGALSRRVTSRRGSDEQMKRLRDCGERSKTG